ncbi:MAG: CIA30 family protein [Opitutus sp.]
MNFPLFLFLSDSKKACFLAGFLFAGLGSSVATAAPATLLIDDFSEVKRNGTDRPLFNDKDVGSHSEATQSCEKGVLVVKGELVPGRGVPAFISVPLLLAADMKPQDMSPYEGVRLRVKVNKGILSVQVASADVTNFDYHTGGPVATPGGGFQEVRLPFKAMKRGWSEQTALNLKSITSVNLVAFGMAKDAFSFEVDEIGFY